MQTEKPEAQKIAIAGYLVLLGFLIILLRLWQLQFLEGDDLRKTSESNRLRVIRVSAPRGIIFDRNGIPLVKNTPYFCAAVIPEEFDNNNIPSLAAVLHMPEDELRVKLNRKAQSPFTPVRLKEGLSYNEVSYIKARRSDFPGLFIDIEVSREYLYGGIGAHVIGYLGKLTPGQSKDPGFKDVPPDAFIGQWGVEKLYDKSLRGTPGQRIIEVDAIGREIRLLKENPAVKGSDLSLSIDMALQKAAEDAFEEKAGALVALKSDTGEILGMVSSPSFDPNSFAKGISADDWNTIINNKKVPMLNRAIQSQYPPGSAFKIITAIAALEENAVDTSTKVDCKGGINYGKWHFGCWKKTGHGIVSLHRALVESCDVYFYEAGKRTGFDKIYNYAIMFGLGEETGISIGRERKGLIPNSRWKQETKKEGWFLGETFINSIGQGYVSTTPVQMAVMINAVTNGGNVYRPSILKTSEPVLIRKAAVRPETLDTIREALKGVVNEPGGTGSAAKSNAIVIGGKTGTAQVVGLKKDSKYLAENLRDHAWFVAFAPVDKPEIALSVFVEHGGHGGSAAAPIAKKAIEAYMLSKERKKELMHVQD
ncbi:MAG: penicillin-binding protein 2 [Nitrospira bacterium HGW-Nitrospira-1]|nr:MAG: penicillin-binding protein 2 [Nitrospira bacterium HGW-Nitrospira-1]